jgi:hypothetical protein
MNANELIELLDKNAGDGDTPLRQAATMLRHQQAEIDSLRKNLDVALMIVNKPKLTDEEIREYILEMPRHASRDELLMFARAILRKAQEK